VAQGWMTRKGVATGRSKGDENDGDRARSDNSFEPPAAACRTLPKPGRNADLLLLLLLLFCLERDHAFFASCDRHQLRRQGRCSRVQVPV
jgi:hypothetical protein